MTASASDASSGPSVANPPGLRRGPDANIVLDGNFLKQSRRSVTCKVESDAVGGGGGGM